MRVAFCTGWDTPRDGIADYSQHLVTSLKRCGVSIKIAKLGFYIDDKSYYQALAKSIEGVDVCHVQFNYVYFNGELPYRNRFLYFLENVKVPVIMTAHEVRPSYKPGQGGFNGDVKKFIFNHTLLFWNTWSHLYHKVVYSRVNKIIVHTRCQQIMVNPFVDSREKIVLIPHGIPEFSRFESLMAKAQAKKKLGLEDKAVVTIFGFINKKKGYELILDILPQLPPEVIFFIAGGCMTDNSIDQEYYQGLLKIIAQKKLQERVRISGYIQEHEIPDIAAATDICLAPFSSTSASGALSLCIGYHKPIVASDIDVHREVNERIPCLELFRHDDAADVREKIMGLLRNQERLSELIELTKEYSARFSCFHIAEKTLEVYQEVLSRNR
ncbi:MAG: glycosyltransferase [Candidatus Omnitrophota bacterium]|jgi:glycosyltransferase involved in cell wall biosynthesis